MNIPIHGMSCQGENCPYPEAWAFRRNGWLGKWLCDICWGHEYGDEVCWNCEKGCYAEEDLVFTQGPWDNVPEGTLSLKELGVALRLTPAMEVYLCGACKRR